MLRKIAERIRTSGAYSPGKVCGDYVVNQTFQIATSRADQGPLTQDPALSSVGQSAIGTLLPKMGPFREIVQPGIDPVLIEETLSVWAQVTDAREPTPIQVVTICQQILEQAFACQSWEIRRLLARIAGTALSRIDHNRDLMRSLDSLRETTGNTEDGNIFLGTALSHVPHVMTMVRRPIAELLSADHPQIPWQILRQSKCLHFLLADQKLATIICQRASDRWLRRQLITTMCNLVHQDRASRPLTILIDLLLRAELRESGGSYLQLLNIAELRTYNSSVLSSQFPMYLHDCDPESKQPVDTLGSNNHVDPTEIPVNYGMRVDLACLHLDLAGDVMNCTGPQGRYGTILDMIRPTLFSASSDVRHELLRDLLECQSEGIRWGVAHLTPEMFRIDRNLHGFAVTRLLTDWHPWVLRETIDCLAKTPDILKTERGDFYVRTVLSVIEELDRTSSPIRHDIKKAFVKLLHKEPRFVESVSISSTEKEGQ